MRSKKIYTQSQDFQSILQIFSQLSNLPFSIYSQIKSEAIPVLLPYIVYWEVEIQGVLFLYELKNTEVVILQKKQQDPTFQELRGSKDFMMVIPTARTITAQWNSQYH